MTVLFTALLIIAHYVIHELGHIIAALAVGSRIKRVGVTWAGPYVVRGRAKTKMRDAIVALAGPGANLLTFALMLAMHAPHPWFPLCLGVVSLLPIPHSDMTNACRYLKEGRD